MTFTIAKIKRKQERQAESQLNKLKSTQTKKTLPTTNIGAKWQRALEGVTTAVTARVQVN